MISVVSESEDSGPVAMMLIASGGIVSGGMVFTSSRTMRISGSCSMRSVINSANL